MIDHLISRKIILVIIAILAVLLVIGLILLLLNTPDNQVTKKTGGELFPVGESRVVPVADENIFPPLTSDDRASSSSLGDEEGGGTIDTGALLTAGRFKIIVAQPVAGAAITSLNPGRIVYLEQADGRIYQTSLTGENTERLSNTTITNVRSVVWGRSGNRLSMVIGRQDGDNFGFNLLSLNESLEPLASSTPVNYYAFAPSPQQDRLLVLARNNQGAQVITTDFNFTKLNEVLGLPFSDWRISWVNDNWAALETRPSSLFFGSLYLLDLKNKKWSKVLGGVSGLTTKVSSSTNHIIYSGVDNGRLFTNLFNRQTGQIIGLDFNTIADKCVWTKDGLHAYCAAPDIWPTGQYPDYWFKGLVSPADNFWKVSAASGTAVMIANTANTGLFNAQQLFLDQENETLFFINKKDLSLWSFDVREMF